MDKKPQNLDDRLDKIDDQLERISLVIIKGFDEASKDRQAIRDEVKQSIDIYSRAVGASAKQSETYMQEMLALGNKVDRL